MLRYVGINMYVQTCRFGNKLFFKIGEDLTGPPVIPLFHAIKIISIFVIGLFYDIMLIAFIKKRNRSVSPKHTRLVPWKSGPQEVKDITVPLHASFANATCISIGKKSFFYCEKLL